MIDFVRVVRVPETAADRAAWADRLPADLRPLVNEPLSKRELRFGLQTHVHKAVWKLHVVIQGHPEFFDGLAGWLGAGGRVVIVKGNHDLEFHWPVLLDVLRAELSRRGAGAEGVRRLSVSQTGFRLKNLLIEHGHTYEPMTAVVGAELLDDGKQLNLPLGSFVNRYFINPLERLDPFLDNLKPSTQALLALLRKRPLKIVSTYLRGWNFLMRALKVRKRAGAWGPVITVAAALLVPPITIALFLLYRARPDLFAWLPGWLRIPTTILGLSFPVVLPFLLGVIRDVLRQFGLMKTTRHLVDGATHRVAALRANGEKVRRFYSVMGHTHEQEVRRLAGADFYVNTGTWIALWPLDRYDLMGKVLHSYARFTLSNGEYGHASLVWDDAAQAPRLAPLLALDGAS
jgi:UDP-2,3-diacylglucosamine pyrophosphatase LpxH